MEFPKVDIWNFSADQDQEVLAEMRSVWAQFAAAVASDHKVLSMEEAAKIADKLMEEYTKRFFTIRYL